MSDKSNTPSNTPSNNNGHTVQKKKSFRNRHKKSNSNLETKLKVKPLEQIDDSEKQNGKKANASSDKIPKKQVNKENNDNKKTEVEKKEVDKKKRNSRYNKKKSMSDLKKEEQNDNVSEAKSDVTNSTNNEKVDLKKSASKQFLNKTKKRKSKMNLKAAEKTEEEQKEEEKDIKLIESFLTSLSMKRDEMEREEEEMANNPPPSYYNTNKNYTKKTYNSYNTNKANKPKKELPEYSNEDIKKVLDCYDFPISYKTHNLLEIFKGYEGKFRINWINDSRALFIFETEEDAKAAYLSKINETKYKLKPYENPGSSYDNFNDPKINAINILKTIL